MCLQYNVFFFEKKTYTFIFQERVNDPLVKSSQCAERPIIHPYAPPMIPMDSDDGISYKGQQKVLFRMISTLFSGVICDSMPLYKFEKLHAF